MTFKQTVLLAFGKEALLGLGNSLELEVASGMTLAELRDKVSRSRRASIEKIVTEGLPLDLLKKICEECGLDATGRAKQDLVKRIVSAAAGEAAAEVDEETKAASTAGDARAQWALTSPVSKAKKPAAQAPRRASSGATDDISAYQHDEKRKNNPPAGLIEFDKPPPQPTKTYAYDPHLDPSLTWAGKAEHTSFEVDTVSLHIHERITPEAILRAVKREDAQMDLFKRNELPESKAIDFYRHDVDWQNRLILGDSLLVMNSLIEREQMAAKVQMAYVDPPYGVKFNSNFQAAISRRESRDGDDSSLTREPEQIQAYRDTWTLGVHTYLTYLRDRLLLLRTLLAEEGSVFVQISDENVHRVRGLMDEVFGAENFVAEIFFRTTTGQAFRFLPTTTDVIVWYSKNIKETKYHKLYARREETSATGYTSVRLKDRTDRKLTSTERDGAPLPDGGRLFALDNLVSQGFRQNTSVPFTFQGISYDPGQSQNWKTTLEGLKRLGESGRLGVSGRTLRYVRFFEDFPMVPLSNLWNDTSTGSFTEDKLYVVQTNTKVIARCIAMTTDPGDLVFDPTCGSGTTAYVAEQWGRRWITCDTSRVALSLARQRLMTSRFPFYELRSPRVRDGFHYKSVPHITLKSIAQNPRLDDCETQAERDRVIRETADQEVLYDQPFEDRDRVRVTGPFTVEAIPVAALDPDDVTGDVDLPKPPEQKAEGYLGMMIDLLKRSGVQFANNKHLPLATLRPVRGPYEYLHAEAELINGVTKRVAISFGPRHAPVTPAQVLAGIAETRDYDMVIFVGFACDPEARRIIDQGVQRRELQFANAAPDILVGDLLKTKKTTRLFSTFGAPDVKVEAAEDDHIKLTLAGVDLYDPNTGETHHRSGEDVAAWFIDHDYDGRTFCVCQALFPGTKNPWEKLQKALKGTIDEEKFDALRTVTSLPFKSGKKVAVKVIDDRGNEVIKLVEPKPSKKRPLS